MQSIRTASRALILKNGKLLTIQMRDSSGIFYILPGGGQQHGDTLKESLIRECKEEIGALVTIKELLYVREYIGRNHEFKKSHRDFHQVESVFRCDLSSSEEIGDGSELDKKQIGVEWLPLGRLKEYRLLPKIIRPFFNHSGFNCPNLYLGDAN